MHERVILLLFGLLILSAPLVAGEITEEELERWFNSDEFAPPRESAIDVNEGELVFLEYIPNERVHHHFNSLTIQPQSLKDGWVSLEQCHENIDRVASAQIVFNHEKIRDIHITSSRNVEKVWVEDSSVQLSNISDNARVCIRAQSRALARQGDGTYTVRSGPFMRRFLDGYYPMRVSMDVNYQGTGLELLDIMPHAQTGFRVMQDQQRLFFDALFEGRLNTELIFHRTPL